LTWAPEAPTLTYQPTAAQKAQTLTSISPDSPLLIAKWIPMSLTAAGFVYLALAILIAGTGGGH